MVQLLLGGSHDRSPRRALWVLSAIFLLMAPAWASRKNKVAPAPPPPDLVMEGGRRLTYERSFSSEREVRPNRGFWRKMVDFVAGAPEFHHLVRPYSIVVDSRGRIIVTDPGARGIHIFDFKQQKYKFISRESSRTDPLRSPQCVALDAQDNIYVTDSQSGKIFVFDANGKFKRTIGSLRGGEGYFKRPTGIAVDSAAQRIYVTDTLRHQIFVLDMHGHVLQTIGKNGDDKGEFNFPTELRLAGPDLMVVDAMNFRVQILDRSGNFESALGVVGNTTGTMFRPKGVAVDSEGNIYVVEALLGEVQVFNRQGELLYYFGKTGNMPGEFQLPAGIFIDRNDRIYVVDSYNRRVQVFHYFGAQQSAKGEQQ
jgi:DNA-binding beta-propeller fold protein YncE